MPNAYTARSESSKKATLSRRVLRISTLGRGFFRFSRSICQSLAAGMTELVVLLLTQRTTLEEEEEERLVVSVDPAFHHHRRRIHQTTIRILRRLPARALSSLQELRSALRRTVCTREHVATSHKQAIYRACTISAYARIIAGHLMILSGAIRGPRKEKRSQQSSSIRL